MGGSSGMFGSKKGPETTVEKSSTTDYMTPEQKKWVNEALALYGPELGKGTDIFPGSRIAPFSTLQEGAISGAENFADYFAEPQQVGTPLFEETGTAVKGLLAGDIGAKPLGAQDVEDYFKGAIYDPTMKTFREDVVPGIEESFSGPGFYGSARSQELSKGYQDVSEHLGTQRAALEWDVLSRNQALEEAKAGRTQTAVPQAMAYGQVPYQEAMNNLRIAASQIGGLSEIFGFGADVQTQEQRELQDEIVRFAQENQITDPENLSILMSLLNLNISSATTGEAVGYETTPSWKTGDWMSFGANVGMEMLGV